MPISRGAPMAERMVRRCAAFADRYGMLPPAGETLLCAVSGGADSVCLLFLLRALAAERGFRVACAHFDHRLRGEESTRDAAFVAALCERLGVPVHLGSGDVAAYAREKRQNLEEAARTLRYAFLEETSDALGGVKIATAHTADDNAETMLLNLSRGAGGRGLAGIPPVWGRRVRPLLPATRREVEAFLKALGESWVTDSSNLTDAYARNRLRHQVMPVLRALNPRFAEHALRTSELLRRDEAYFEDLAAQFLETHGKRENGTLRLPVSALSALAYPVCARVLRLLCGPALEAGHVEAVCALLEDGRSGRSADVPGMRVRREMDELVFGARAPETLPARELPPDGELYLPELDLLVRRTEDALCEIHNSFNIFFFKKTKVCGKILIRCRQSGDELCLAGRSCTKSLKKLFAEARVPVSRRGLIPVIADERGVLAVAGFGADARRTAEPGERAVRIELMGRRTQ